MENTRTRSRGTKFRVVENAEFGKRGLWKTRGVENTGCGKRSVENAGTGGKHGV